MLDTCNWIMPIFFSLRVWGDLGLLMRDHDEYMYNEIQSLGLYVCNNLWLYNHLLA